MNPTCMPPNILYQGLCYASCPSNTEPANEDITKCVTTATCSSFVPSAPQSLVNDTVFDLVCNKIPVQETMGSCPTGFTAWQTGMCYVNCPAGLLENGLTCLKRPIQRPYTLPMCNNLYSFDGQSCTINYAAIFVLFLLFVALVWLVTPRSKRA